MLNSCHFTLRSLVHNLLLLQTSFSANSLVVAAALTVGGVHAFTLLYLYMCVCVDKAIHVVTLYIRVLILIISSCQMYNTVSLQTRQHKLYVC